MMDLFHILDTDGEGVLSSEEFKQGMGHLASFYTYRLVLDVDGNEVISTAGPRIRTWSSLRRASSVSARSCRRCKGSRR